MFETACISKFEIDHQIDGSASVDSTVVQAWNQRLRKRWFDDYTSADSTVGQASNRQLYKPRQLYWLFFKKVSRLLDDPSFPR